MTKTNKFKLLTKEERIDILERTIKTMRKEKYPHSIILKYRKELQGLRK